MSPILRTLSLLCLAGTLSGCLAMSTDDPIPVTADTPNPAPIRSYRLQCQSEPTIFNVISGGYATACQQLIVPTGRTTVIRAKG